MDIYFPVSRRLRLRISSRETGSAVPPRATLLILHTKAEYGAYSHGIPPVFRDGAHLCIPPFAVGSVSSLAGHATAYRWRSLPRVRRHNASSPQGSSSNGCRLLRYHHGPFIVRLSFHTPTIPLWHVVDIMLCDTESIERMNNIRLIVKNPSPGSRKCTRYRLPIIILHKIWRN